ncbi:DUF3606 domain-containing protein [Comamonas sp. w2-DMI]|uniref:DUF3606 domain-containing protein n=1 Tax=Comamonas sp. w2-DMI TaxID=3126391 RepID=UPI0032E49D7F
MHEDHTTTKPEGAWIHLEMEHELRDWTWALECSEDRLREAVAAVGNGAVQVREYLEHR